MLAMARHGKVMRRGTFAALMVSLLLIVVSGCASLRSHSSKQPPVQAELKEVRIVFDSPLKVAVPQKDPVTLKEHVLCGLFYFDTHKYDVAANEFQKAMEQCPDKTNSIYRACVLSAAICYLLSDNKQAFTQAVQELKSTYTKYELVNVQNLDPRIRRVMELSTLISKTISYKEGGL